MGIGMLSKTFEFNDDEGMELQKAFELHTDTVLPWNDQPWLFTQVLAGMFEVFGVSVEVARGFAIGSVVLMIFGASCFLIRARGRVGGWAVVAFLFVVQSYANEVALSAIPEVPALGFASMGAALAVCAVERRSVSMLGLGGILLGIAPHFKLTAVMIYPAIAASMAVRLEGGGCVGGLSRMLFPRGDIPERNIGDWKTVLPVCVVALVAVITGSALFLATPSWDWGVMSRSHLGGYVVGAADDPMFRSFSVGSWTGYPAVWVAVVLGIVLCDVRREWRFLVFPVGWLLTVYSVHLFHSPWWEYYYLHFTVPICILAGNGCVLAGIRLRRIVVNKWRMSCASDAVAVVGGIILVVSLVTVSWPRVKSEVGRLEARMDKNDDNVLRELRARRQKGDYIFTDELAYAFHGRLKVPSRIGILPAKRFWSGQISGRQVLEKVRAFEPRFIVMNFRIVEGGWRRLLKDQYEFVTSNGEYSLFVRERKKGFEDDGGSG